MCIRDRDGILQTLSSIAAMGTFVYKGHEAVRVKLKPKVFLVGTHKDKLVDKYGQEEADRRIASVSDCLRCEIKATSHYNDLIELPGDSLMMFTVNNHSTSDSDFHRIRLAVEQVTERDEWQMTSPAHWLIYSLALRKLKVNVANYLDCRAVAKECGIYDPQELNAALHFIHSKMGLICYFRELKNVVIINPQFLFDEVTHLIVKTFVVPNTKEQTVEKFKNGIFSLTEFEKISAKRKLDIEPSQFGILLEKLWLTVRFMKNNEVHYFFPCAIAHAYKMEENVEALSIPPLVVSFECGYCPKGLAGALIKYLMANKMSSIYTWKLCDDKIFRNQVSFKVGPVDTVELKIFSTYLQITCRLDSRVTNDERSSRSCPLNMLCPEICKAIDTGIKHVTLSINYINAQHSLTFLCECKQVEINHPGVLDFVAGKPVSLSCSKSGDNLGSGLPTGYELWQITEVAKQKEELAHVPQKHISTEAQSKPGEASNCGKGIIIMIILMFVGCSVGMRYVYVMSHCSPSIVP